MSQVTKLMLDIRKRNQINKNYSFLRSQKDAKELSNRSLEAETSKSVSIIPQSNSTKTAVTNATNVSG